MARVIYTETASFSTPNLSISIDGISGILSSTYAGSMSYFSNGVGTYSSTSNLTVNSQNILANGNTNYTLTLPTLPPDGTTLVIRSTTTVNPIISAGTYSIRNVGSASGVTSFQMVANGAYTLAYYGGVWYGI